MNEDTANGSRSPAEARVQKLEERQRDMIHVAELRELVKEWREDADETTETAYKDAQNTLERASYLTKAEGIRFAADELEALIDDE